MGAGLQTARQDVAVHLGTELLDVRLTEMDDAEVEALKLLVAERGVVFLRAQDMTLDEQVAFGRRMGELLPNPAASPGVEGHPDVFHVRNDATSTFSERGAVWHTDQSFWARPPAFSMLRVETLPPVGGDTLFTSMYGVYDSLSPRLQDFLLTLTARHDGAARFRARLGVDGPLADLSFVHPVVRSHPMTGRKLLWVNAAYTDRLLELEEGESDALLRFLFDKVANAVAYQVRFRWERNSVALWDNRCVQHSVCWDYHPETREGFRVMTVGEQPYLEA
ncbi:MAG: taurine dioxygenase [Actinomycetia bacterium]|nr:taurine dioxygenase [Actinomycetes bacterium]